MDAIIDHHKKLHNGMAAVFRNLTKRTPFICVHPGCGKKFGTSQSLAGHQLNHTNILLRQLPDRDQYGRFKSAHKRRHRQIVITANKSHICDYPGCNKQFTNENSLLGHRLNHAKKKKIVAKTK